MNDDTKSKWRNLVSSARGILTGNAEGDGSPSHENKGTGSLFLGKSAPRADKRQDSWKIVQLEAAADAIDLYFFWKKEDWRDQSLFGKGLLFFFK